MRAVVEGDGDDLVITLPQELIDDLELIIGDEIEITEENGRIVIARKDSLGH